MKNNTSEASLARYVRKRTIEEKLKAINECIEFIHSTLKEYETSRNHAFKESCMKVLRHEYRVRDEVLAEYEKYKDMQDPRNTPQTTAIHEETDADIPAGCAHVIVPTNGYRAMGRDYRPEEDCPVKVTKTAAVERCMYNYAQDLSARLSQFGADLSHYMRDEGYASTACDSIIDLAREARRLPEIGAVILDYAIKKQERA